MTQPTPPPPPTPLNTSSSLPIHITVRFSSSYPDIDLDVPSPHTTTVLSLKHLLRQRLSSRSRLRLIYQGRLLPDELALGAVLKPPPTPTSSSTPHSQSPSPSPYQQHGGSTKRRDDDPKGKGKGKANVLEPEVVRIYVNCSIGDELSPEDLEAERVSALKPPSSPSGGNGTNGSSNGDNTGTAPPPSTRPRPRGFDRLLGGGFTASEIATLRTQFSSIQAERRAPDDPPLTPDTMRSLEDAWIDTNAGELPAAGGGRGGGAGGTGVDDEMNEWMTSLADVLIRGMMIGFFWPLGSLMWLLRLEIYNDKWQTFVGAGVVLSLAVGIVMGVAGER